MMTIRRTTVAWLFAILIILMMIGGFRSEYLFFTVERRTIENLNATKANLAASQALAKKNERNITKLADEVEELKKQTQIVTKLLIKKETNSR